MRQKKRHLGSASGGQRVRGLLLFSKALWPSFSFSEVEEDEEEEEMEAKLSARAQWLRGFSIMAGVTPTW